jgi:hypothetical protein
MQHQAIKCRCQHSSGAIGRACAVFGEPSRQLLLELRDDGGQLAA